MTAAAPVTTKTRTATDDDEDDNDDAGDDATCGRELVLKCEGSFY